MNFILQKDKIDAKPLNLHKATQLLPSDYIRMDKLYLHKRTKIAKSD